MSKVFGFMSLVLVSLSWGVEAAMVKSYVMLEKETIQLQDLFEGLTEHRDIIVAAAPAPGQKTTYSFTFLNTLAQQYRVDWQSATKRESIVVERMGRELTSQEILPILKENLAQKVNQPTVELTLDGGMPKLLLGSHNAQVVNMEDLSVDATQDRFVARISVAEGSAGSPKQHLSLTGRLVKMVEIPVLNKDLKAGTVITEADIVLQAFPSTQLQGNVLHDPEQLINCNAPYKSLKAHQPLFQHDIKEPLVIQRDSLVTMVLKRPGIVVTAKGKALDDAKAGKLVRVMNIDSKKIIAGIAEKSGIVRIETARGTY